MDSLNFQPDPLDVEAQLHSLNLSPQLFSDLGDRGMAQYFSPTELHPKGAGGSLLYLEIVPGLREFTLPLGYEPKDVGGVCLTINESNRCAIAVSSGDEKVGVSARLPNFRYPKGMSAQKLVAIAAGQVDFFDHPVMSNLQNYRVGESFAELEGYSLWWYLHFVDLEKQEYRHELSLPGRVDNFGNVVSWQDRIILSPISYGPSTSFHDIDFSESDIEDSFVVEVRKKK